MKEYSWNFHEDDELWYNDPCDTIEGCLSEAARQADEDDLKSGVVFIGMNEPFEPNVYAEFVLDQITSDAYEFAGDVVDGWDAYNMKNRGELDELSETLTKAVREWMRKYGYYPNFYQITGVKKYTLPDSAYRTKPKEGTGSQSTRISREGAELHG